MFKNQVLKTSVLALLGLFVLVSVSACTLNKAPVEVDSEGESQGELIDGEEDLVEERDVVEVETPLINNNWLWTNTVKADGEIEPVQKEAFIMIFNADMTVSGTTDCNYFFGDYQATEEGELSFGHLASTMMYCEDAQENEFTKDLSEVDSYTVDEDGNLSLNLKDEAGTMNFELTELSGE